MRKSFYIFLVFPLIASFGPVDLYQGSDSLFYLENALEELGRMGRIAPTCDLDQFDFRDTSTKNAGGGESETRTLDTCGLDKLCQPFRRGRDQRYTYQSSDGGRIRNNQMAQLELRLAACRGEVLKGSLSPVPNVNPSPIGTQNIFGELEQILSDRELDFLIEFSAIYSDDAYGGGGNFAQTLRSFLSENNFPQEHYGKIIDRMLEHRRLVENLDPLPTFSTNADPFFFPTNFLNADVKNQHQAEIDQNNLKANRLFEESKAEMIIFLSEKFRTTGDQGYQAMMNRVKTIEFRPFQGTPEEISVCLNPNAFYEPNRHSVRLCPQLLAGPEEMMRSVFFHEISHSIDPCTMSFEFQTTEFRGGKDFIGTGPDGAPIQSQLPVSDQGYSVNIFEVNRSLQNLGHRRSLEKIDEGLIGDKYPFHSVVSCLESWWGMNASSMDRGDYDEFMVFMKNYVSSDAEKPGDLLDFSYAFQSEIYNNNPDLSYERNRHCNIPVRRGRFGESQTGEAFSDWVSGELMARRIEKAEPLERRRIAFESLSIQANEYCESNLSYDFKKDYEKLLEDAGCEPGFSLSGLFDEIISIFTPSHNPGHIHPESEDRVNYIFLSQPEIAEALGCKANGELCE